jgi:cell wall-associated NlpC family hydrolase
LMNFKYIPRVLVVCCACAIYSISVFAQASVNRSQPDKQIVAIGEPVYVVNDDPVIISVAEAGAARSLEEPKPIKSILSSAAVALAKMQPMLSAAIEHRLGAPYHWGSEGPNSFDCSGFVWSSFQSIGVDFERGSARTLWSRFEAPAPEETYKFGNLVFFSNQTHVGIVADEKGFYHASRHHGVVYAPFNDYWLKRIDGFRRVPMPATTGIDQTIPLVTKKLAVQ